jgi:hypothetical protein
METLPNNNPIISWKEIIMSSDVKNTLVQEVAVAEYNARREELSATNAPTVVDTTGNGIIDKGDEVTLSDGTVVTDMYKKLEALQDVCDVMAPGHSSFELTDASRRLLISDGRATMEQGVHGQTLHIQTGFFGEIPFQTMGQFADSKERGEAPACYFNEPGVSTVRMDTDISESVVFADVTGPNGTERNYLDLFAKTPEDLYSVHPLCPLEDVDTDKVQNLLERNGWEIQGSLVYHNGELHGTLAGQATPGHDLNRTASFEPLSRNSVKVVLTECDGDNVEYVLNLKTEEMIVID